MLILAESLKDVPFGELMAVYEGTNRENARRKYGYPDGFSLRQEEADFYQYLREIFFRTPGAVYALWEAQGHCVSALRLEPYRDGWIVSALETAPEQRRKGYAALLIRNVQLLCADRGVGKLYSHVDKHNGASLGVHKKCGFRVASDHAAYLDGSVDSRSFTLVFEG